ncbi:2-oxoglutarate:acceptor oxidoreductase [Campylobacter sp. LH-2024]|uniref:effector protein CiaD n=1 Tax=Campylobacter TaxID=194 RepID=UPI001DA1A645|nr:2-oxoglutarate:acceptor oxidoreductase [Campylobacter sp. RM10538]MBZ7940266.1 2-oxoglutarate:acceptor oxidoreductase [Campylobacter sp. W0047]MBZ7941538.1 2-oxoglutarate:acceptor oxidoreductase [Campylobacter sp. W0045]MBZ7944464.1 2-oxoglutarate:acceptor oxidoreductase [Campylobacter sp. RM10532]MBZ7947526.1 2-oxoglutarate:acceptor oxidoreductase [Campylobacter sp. RM9929]MBZ7950462.1 2-oxoglutarate:acceptor oxidoreductase [Campylobacter sp. W0046]MBZ7959756.1 2-oxoglutarate:acceptor oxi
MNLEDLAKKTISEVSSIMEEQRRQSEILKQQEDIIKSNEKNDEPIIEETSKDFQDEMTAVKKQEIEITTQNTEESENLSYILEEKSHFVPEPQSFNEEIFFSNLRERILVLFEGLNSVKKEDLESRLNLTTNFLEFLLANIEDRLKK